MWGEERSSGGCREVLEESDKKKKPKTGSPRSTASKADKRKKMCSVCCKRFCSLQDLMWHMRPHTGERLHKSQTCRWTFSLKHSMVHHQKAQHTEHHNKDSEREAREDGKNEFNHSGITHMSESEVDLGLLANNHMVVTQSKERMATMRRGQ